MGHVLLHQRGRGLRLAVVDRLGQPRMVVQQAGGDGDVDFGGATIKRARFPGCTLTGADFSRAALDKVDLRGADLDITAGYESLRGAIISTAQLLSMAPSLARQIGIVVRDS